MPSVTDQAVCIRHWDWSETSQTVSLLTRDHGIVRGLAKGAKRERSSYSGGIELLTRGEVLMIVKPGDALAVITSWDLRETFPAASRSLRAFHAGMFLIDAVAHALTTHDPHPNVFDALLTALRALAAPGHEESVVVAFLWSLLTDTGHQPEVHAEPAPASPTTYGFAPRLGTLVPDPGDGIDVVNSEPVWRVRAETVRYLRSLSRGESTSSAAAPRALRLLASYFREVFGVEPASMPPMLAAFQPATGSRGE
jgi:DNA repair protein RecO